MSTRKIAAITSELLTQLRQVPAATDGQMDYRPCLVVLDDGTRLPRVYVVEAEAYMTAWGVWPWDDRAKSWVPIERVSRIEDSPDRLPAQHANAIYKVGESGMGYVVFTVVLRDGRRLPYLTGNAVDFPRWPAGVRPDMVATVLPHHGRELFRGRPQEADELEADYVWCLYSAKGK